MQESSFTAALPSIRLIRLLSITTVQAYRFWKSYRNRISAVVKKLGHILKSYVLSCSIWAYPTAVWKKAACVVMPIFLFVLLARRRLGRKRKSRISIPSAVYRRELNTKLSGKHRFWKMAALSSRLPVAGMKQRALRSFNVSRKAKRITAISRNRILSLLKYHRNISNVSARNFRKCPMLGASDSRMHWAYPITMPIS